MTNNANTAFWSVFCALPVQIRSAIVLGEAEQLTLDEIAAVLGADQGAIQELLLRGRRRLQQSASLVAPDTSENRPLHPSLVAALKAMTAPAAGFHDRLHDAVTRQLDRPTSLEN